jgi:hypothetical protein
MGRIPMSDRDVTETADVLEGGQAETGTRIGAVPGAGATPDLSGDRNQRVTRGSEPSAEMVGGAATDPAASDREPGDRTYGLDDEGGNRYGAAGTGTAAGEERLGAYPEEGRDEARRGPADVAS